MRISFERSGGFAGNIRFKAEADTKARQLTRGATRASRELSADESSQLEQLVQQIDLDSVAQNRSIAARPEDSFQYDLTIETDDGQRHSLHLGESSDEGPLDDLISYLTRLAKER